VPPPSPSMPPVSLEQLLASQNAIMQRLAAIDEPQESSYFDFFGNTTPIVHRDD
jgi:hypothetical protein